MNRFLPALFLFFYAANLTPQSIANYSTARTTGVSYSSISSSGNSFTWRNTTSATGDDNRSDFSNIGFDFWYNGIRYTQFCVSTNGFIDFSTSTDDGGPLADDFGYDNTSFTNSNLALATRPAIAAFYDDISTQGSNDPLGSCVKYKLTGSSPNRVLTVEWVNMTVASNATPLLNFQVQLFENTGAIYINYGNMNGGTYGFSYGMGINGSTMGATPSATELKMLQANNGNVLNNTVQNNLSGTPTSNSRYSFTPPVPLAPTGSIAFTAVSSSGMTLNWTNWATNEVGYAIYNSTDGVTYNFVTQTAANAVSSVVSGLLPATTYYWKIYAVTEGCLSSALSGTNATSGAGTKTSNGSGNWSSANTWTPNGVPTSGDNVTIANGHVITINANASCNNIVVGQGTSGTLQYNNGGTGTSLTANNITINNGGLFWVPNNSNTTNSLTIKGDVVNSGSLNLYSDANSFVRANFSKNGNQTVSGTGSFSFQVIDVNLGTSNTNTLDITAPTFTATNGFLNLLNGTFKLAANNAATVTPFTTTTTIPSSAGLWLNAPNITFSTTANITLAGKMTLLGGTFNVGDAANEDLLISGGSLNLQGGTIKVGGKLYTSSVNNVASVTISGGTITVPAYSSTNTSIAPFNLGGTGSTFTMSGGQIIIPREGGTGAQDLGYVNTIAAGSVTGGTLQLGNSSTPVSQTISVNSLLPVGNLVVSSGSATAVMKTNSLSVIGSVAINSGTLNCNNLNITLGGNWTSAGSFTPGTAQVTFSSTTAQYINRTGGETFNHLLFTGGGVKTFSSAITAAGNFSVSGGASVDVSAANNQLTVKGNYLNNGTFNARTGLVHFNGTTAQTIGGSSITDFYDITLGNTSGASLTGAENLLGTLTLTAGVLNTNSQVFTMVSTATACARIAQITGTGDITGNVTVQRYAPGGTTGWALWGTPISSALTLNDWDDDIPISCPTCPDGSAGGFLSIYTYDETATGLYDDYYAYIPLSTINDAISASKGYWVYLGLAQYTTAAITIDVTGSVRKFNQTIPLSYTNYGSSADDGWNLIQNPYPSPISWSALKGTTSNIDNAVYIYNTDLNGGSGGFATYINGISSPAVSSGGIGNTIPMSQAFYVHSTGATALNATEAIKVAGNPTYLKAASSTSTVSSLARINLKGNAFDDETVLYIQPGATSNFDNDFDAVKMRGQDPSAPSIALEKGTDLFQVNGVAPITGNFVMPLKTLTGYSGTYTISASGFSTFPHGACIYLYDKFKNTTTDLKTNNYIFNLADTTTVARFELRITINHLSVNATIQQPSCQATSAGQIVAGGTGNGPWNYYWTMNGTPVKTTLNQNGNDTLSNLSNGIYDLEVNTSGMCNNNYSSHQVIPQSTTYALFFSADTLDLNLSSSMSFFNLSSNASSYLWDFGDGSGSSVIASPVHYYSTPGNYTVSMICWSSSGCSDTITKVITVMYSVPDGINTYGINTSGLIVKNTGWNEYQVEQQFNDEQVLTISLVDAFGKTVKDFGSISTKNLQFPVSLNNYSRGLYMLNITSGTAKKVIKIPAR
jgi:hypothetical protein